MARVARRVDPLASLGPLPPGLHAEADEDEIRVFVRVDLLHLDADALHDRLAHWTQTTLASRLPRASATVSFRHARPADPHEDATLDLQAGWLGLEPTFALERHGATAEDVERFRSLFATFLGLIKKNGRPEGYRSPDVGALE